MLDEPPDRLVEEGGVAVVRAAVTPAHTHARTVTHTCVESEGFKSHSRASVSVARGHVVYWASMLRICGAAKGGGQGSQGSRKTTEKPQPPFLTHPFLNGSGCQRVHGMRMCTTRWHARGMHGLCIWYTRVHGYMHGMCSVGGALKEEALLARYKAVPRMEIVVREEDSEGAHD